MSRTLVALLLAAAAAAAPGAAAREPLAVINECIARLEPLEVGYERIRARCPELTPALTRSAAAPWLPAGWDEPRNELSAPGLRELATAIERAERPPAVVRLPSVSRVPAVLALIGNAEESPSLWARFKAWLHELLAPRTTSSDPWWRRMLEWLGFTSGVVSAVLWLALAAVVALLGAILGKELREWGAWQRSRDRALDGAANAAPRAAPTLREIEAAELLERPRLLLERIAARLAADDRLPPPRALTAREMARAASLPDARARAVLAALAGVCERVRYSAETQSGERVALVLREGRELLGVLEAGAPLAMER